MRSVQSIRSFIRWFYRYRSLRLTPEGLRFLLLTIALGIGALNTGNNLLYLLLAMMLSLIVVSGVLSEKCLKDLAIHRRTPSHLFAGRPATAALGIMNKKARFPSFSLKFFDIIHGAAQDSSLHLLHLPPKATATLSYRVLFPQRGRYQIEAIKISTRFPFGLFVKSATLPLESEVLVYPNPESLPEALLHTLEAMGYDREIPRRGPGSGLYNLRDYQAGDDSRTVHWKVSARQSRLMVRETEAEDQRMVTVALPTIAPLPAPRSNARSVDFERAIVLMASLVAHFHRQGFAIRALVGDSEAPYGTGEVHLYRILRELALCTPSEREGGAIPSAFLTLANSAALGHLVLLVLPWEDQNLRLACAGGTQIVEAWE